MKRFAIVICISAVAAIASGGFAAEVIDRIVVVVNRTPIVQSEWDEQVRFEALVDGRAIPAEGSPDRAAALERLIEQALVAEQIANSNYVAADEREIAAAVAQVRQQVAPGDTWPGLLRRYGLTETDVARHLRRQVNQLRYIELRFRRDAKVTSADIDRYYREKFVPEVRRAGAKEQPLSAVEPQIEQILIEQRINDLVAAWLQTLRAGATIERHDGGQVRTSEPARGESIE